MPRKVDWLGMRFGRLTVTEVLPGRKARTLCDCGKEAIVARNNLTSGNTASCGCLLNEGRIARKLSHGMTNTRTYEIWCGMVKRCSNPNSIGWNLYGGRGVRVCEQWLSFENFFADMGEAPDGMSIERKDNDKGYCKENCTWATASQQSRNRRSCRRLLHEGEILTAIEWAERFGIPYRSFYYRLKKHGFNVGAALAEMGAV